MKTWSAGLTALNQSGKALLDEKENAQDGKWPLEIDTCTGTIEIGNNVHTSNTIFT